MRKFLRKTNKPNIKKKKKNPKLIQEETANLNKLTINEKIELVIKNT
jgi:hypothetical protein